MTTATGKPVTADESANELLGSIVREHLERAASSKTDHPDADPAPDTAAAMHESPVDAPVAEAPALPSPDLATSESLASEPTGEVTSAEKTDLITQASDPASVQKEFDALFAGNASSAPAPLDPPAAHDANPDEARLSREELDALLASSDKPEEATAEQVLAEAEGVLKEELAQLMAAPAVQEFPAPAPAESAEARAPVPAPMPVVDPGSMPPVVVIEAPEEPELEIAAPRKRSRLLSDTALVLGQLVDLPFSWIPDAEKNLLALAAFLLLLGGAVLYILSYMTR